MMEEVPSFPTKSPIEVADMTFHPTRSPVRFGGDTIVPTPVSACSKHISVVKEAEVDTSFFQSRSIHIVKNQVSDFVLTGTGIVKLVNASVIQGGVSATTARAAKAVQFDPVQDHHLTHRDLHYLSLESSQPPQ